MEKSSNHSPGNLISAEDNLGLEYLPAYADYILQNHLEPFVRELIIFSKEVKIPLLRYFTSYTDDELVKLGMESNTEMLQLVSEYKVIAFIERTSTRFLADDLPLINREAVMIDDITLVSLVRRKTFRKFLLSYTTDALLFSKIMEEVDRFTVTTEAASFHAYNEIQQQRLSKINEELMHSEAMLNHAQALTHIGNWSWDLADNNITWSDEMYRIYGLEPQVENITFERFMSLIHPDDRAKRMEEIQQSLQTGEAVDYFLRIVNPGGEIKMLKGKGEVLKDENKKPLKFNGTCQDVTREHLLNKDLQEKEQIFQQLIHNAPDAVIVINIESIITLWNPKTTDIFGWTAEEAIGRNLTETIIPAKYKEAHEQGMKRFLATGEANILNKTLELTACNKNKKEFYISLTISETIQAGNKAFVAFLRDISIQKQTQLELQKKSTLLEFKNLELQRINEELESFNFAASHDLQEPLRKIQTYSSRILDRGKKGLDPNVMKDLDKIMTSSARMQKLIQDLLSFSQNTLKSQDTEAVDLNTIIEEVKHSFIDKMEEKRVYIHAEKLPVVKVVPFQFLQLFINLLGNAVKYHRPGIAPIIHIRSALVNPSEIKIEGPFPSQHYLLISIMDNGIGFETAYANKIFDLFTRLHNKETYSGTGIGLATCKKIVHNHEGYIRAESTPGEGSTFFIYLPEEIIVSG